MNNKTVLKGCLLGLIICSGTAQASTEKAIALLQKGYDECKTAHIQRRKDFDAAKERYQQFIDIKEQAVAADANILESGDAEAVRILSYCDTVGNDIARSEALPVFQQGLDACEQADVSIRDNKVSKAEKEYQSYLSYKQQAVDMTAAVLDVYSVGSGIRKCERVLEQIQEAKQAQGKIVAQLEEAYNYLGETLSICQTVVGSFKTDQELTFEVMDKMVADIGVHQKQVPNAGIWSSDNADGFKLTNSINERLKDIKGCQQSATASIEEKKAAIAAAEAELKKQQEEQAKQVAEAVEPEPEPEPVETPEERLQRLIENGKNFKLVKQVPPRFPRTNRDEVNGSVLVEYTVLTNGKVTDVSVVKSDLSKSFDKAAIASVRKWRYQASFPEDMEPDVAIKRAKIDFSLVD